MNKLQKKVRVLEDQLTMVVEILFMQDIVDVNTMDDINARIMGNRRTPGIVLDEDKVRYIRSSLRVYENEVRDMINGDMPDDHAHTLSDVCVHFAKEYECSIKCIQDVITGRTWASVQPTPESMRQVEREFLPPHDMQT